MDKNSLVVLRQGIHTVTLNEICFKADTFYRCSPEPKDNGYIIFGTWITQTEYKAYFELTHTRVLRDFKTLSLVDANNKPVSKAMFKAGIYQQVFRGRNRTTLYVFYFYTHPKELCYAFYPSEDKKPQTLTQCYNWFLEIVAGNVEALDNTDVVFGNSGLPIGSYRQIYVK